MKFYCFHEHKPAVDVHWQEPDVNSHTHKQCISTEMTFNFYFSTKKAYGVQFLKEVPHDADQRGNKGCNHPEGRKN